MYTSNPNCMICHEPIDKHSGSYTGYLCRYEQEGWIDVNKRLPAPHRRVLARRGKEVFVAMRKDFGGILEWVYMKRYGNETTYFGVEGIDAWRGRYSTY
jgi:hypothetical protein